MRRTLIALAVTAALAPVAACDDDRETDLFATMKSQVARDDARAGGDGWWGLRQAIRARVHTPDSSVASR